MSDIDRVGDLEIDQDLEFQRRDWKAQRVGWVAMVLLMLGAVVGLFGRGPLSTVTAGAPDAPFRVQYDRFVRRQSDEQMKLHVAPGAVAREARILMDSALLASIRIERFTPEPESQAATPGGVEYVFRADSTRAPLMIRVNYKSTGYWSRGGAITLSDRPPLPLRFFVYP